MLSTSTRRCCSADRRDRVPGRLLAQAWHCRSRPAWSMASGSGMRRAAPTCLGLRQLRVTGAGSAPASPRPCISPIPARPPPPGGTDPWPSAAFARRTTSHFDHHRWRVGLDLADLSTSEHLNAVGLSHPTPTRRSWPAFQTVGEQLLGDGWRGLLAPSAARPGALVMCIFIAAAWPPPGCTPSDSILNDRVPPGNDDLRPNLAVLRRNRGLVDRR